MLARDNEHANEPKPSHWGSHNKASIWPGGAKERVFAHANEHANEHATEPKPSYWGSRNKVRIWPGGAKERMFAHANGHANEPKPSYPVHPYYRIW